MFASQAHKAGLNPAEEIYSIAIERFGYQPKKADESAGVEKAKPVSSKPNLSVIAANKKRSATGLAGGGQGSGGLTAADVQNMSNAEFSRLTATQLRELEQAS
jgi:hypothetical protein